MLRALLCLCALFLGSDAREPVVMTAYGPVHGVLEQVPDVIGRMTAVYAYKGVRYARPPQGWLRFLPPREPERWSSPPQSSGEPCPQYTSHPAGRGFRGSEDCLYMDVYVPVTSQRLPVVVFIPGADFHTGGKQDVSAGYSYGLENIFVVINYRLGVLGFLSTEDDMGRGNLGLRDQQAALKFVKENIASFGGDPNAITLMGFGAGAMSVSFHTLNEASSDLFRSAIISGGSATSPDATVERARQNAVTLGSGVGCDYRDSDRLLNCLREVNPRKLVEFAHHHKIKFLPIVDANVTRDAFLSDTPQALYGQFAPKPTVYGYTEQAGSMRYFGKAAQAEKSTSVDEMVRTFLNEYFLDEDSRVGVTAAVKYQYYRPRSSRNNATSNAINTIKMLTDFLVGAPVQFALTSHLTRQTRGERNEAYLYIFGYPNGERTFSTVGQRELSGATYMDDMLYTVPTTASAGGVQAVNQALVGTMNALFSNFIRAGNPGGVLSTATGLTNPSYAHISQASTVRVSGRYRPQEMAFWNIFVPDLHVQLNRTSWSSYIRGRDADYFRSATWGTVTVVVLLTLIVVGLVAAFFVYRRQRKYTRKLRAREDVCFEPIAPSSNSQV